MLKTMSFWDLCEKYKTNRGEVVTLLQNSKRKELEEFTKRENLFVYGKKKNKQALINSILSWLQQHYLITKRAV